MNNDLLFDGKTYISVGRASKKFGYTADYIGQLCRAGKIDARMIGRTWYVEWESIKNHKKTKKHRVRRTKEEILRERAGGVAVANVEVDESKEDCPPEEYLKKVDLEVKADPQSAKKEIFSEPISNLIPISAVLENKTKDKVEIYHQEVPRHQVESALPISYSYDIQNDWLPKLSKKTESRQIYNSVSVIPKYNPMLAMALGIFIFLNLMFVGASIMSPQIISTSIAQRIEGALDIFDRDAELALNSNANTENTSSVYSGIKGAWDFISDSISLRINRFAVKYMNSLGFAQKTNELEISKPKTPITQGLVVLPDDKNHDAKVASIKKTFSDEVEIKPDADAESGVIVPKFREADGDGYTYVLIPIDSP